VPSPEGITVIADLRGKDVLSNLAGRIVDSYHALETIEHLDQSPLPNYQVVTGITSDLKEIIFPGYHQFRNLHWTNVAEHVADLLNGLYDRLREQIACALRYEVGGRGLTAGTAWNVDDADKRAREKALAFLQSIPELRRIIATDVQAAYDGDPAAHGPDEIIFCYPGLEAITIYRLAHGLHSLHVPLVPRMMTEWAHSRTGIDVHPGAQIGPGFFIDHGTGVVIGETCEIADHVKLYQGVTLGAISFEHDSDGNLVRGTKRHPTIERKVVIYANATILGGETVIGAHSVIGAGVSVTKSVPPNTVVTVEKPSLRFREAPVSRTA
jgi:serine O-acetyltransferase